MYRRFLLSILVCLLARGAAAATLDVPLDLGTPPDPWTTVVDEVALEVPDAPITSISIHLAGTWIDQVYWCFFPYVNRYESARIEVMMGDEVIDAPALSALYSFPQSGESQAFEVDVVLFTGDSAGLDFLADGELEVGLAIRAVQGVYAGAWPCQALNVPVEVESASLRIGSDSGVPTTRRSWSALKQSWE